MSYALIVNGAVAQYPYSFQQLRLDNPNISFPEAPSDVRLKDFGVVKIAETTKPVVDLTKNIEEGTPALIGNVWSQVWNVVDASAEEIAARQLRAQKKVERDEVITDAAVTAFINATPAQVASYVDNTATTIAGARTVLLRLALMLHVLARREFEE